MVQLPLADQLNTHGFSVIPDVFTNEECNTFIETIECGLTASSSIQRSKSVFAIRNVLREIPRLHDLIFNRDLVTMIGHISGAVAFIVKTIYFDKPGQSNWFVAWHQDITIEVDKRMELEGYTHWAAKEDRITVQPPASLLAQNVTLRIHLDDTTENNGALRVIPGSHLGGVWRADSIKADDENVTTCIVPRGGVMLMKPLLMHASSRTLNHQNRRVLHIELSSASLPAGLNWAESSRLPKYDLNTINDSLKEKSS